MRRTGSRAPVPVPDKPTGAHPAVQAGLGLLMSALGFVLTVGLAAETGTTGRLGFLLPLAAVAGCALAWLSAWLDRGRPARKIAPPALLLLASAGPLLAIVVREDNQMWIGLAAFGLGFAWAASSVWRLVRRPGASSPA